MNEYALIPQKGEGKEKERSVTTKTRSQNEEV
jgi:hypothetical protein